MREKNNWKEEIITFYQMGMLKSENKWTTKKNWRPIVDSIQHTFHLCRFDVQWAQQQWKQWTQREKEKEEKKPAHKDTDRLLLNNLNKIPRHAFTKWLPRARVWAHVRAHTRIIYGRPFEKLHIIRNAAQKLLSVLSYAHTHTHFFICIFIR